MKSITTYFLLVKMSIRCSLQYKTAFVLDLLTSIAMFVSEFFMVYLLAVKMSNINGWSSDQLAIMYVITVLAGAIECFFTSSFRWIAGRILKGELDTMMVRPVSVAVQVAGNVSVSALLNVVLFSIVVLTYLTLTIPNLWSLYNIALFGVSIIGGAMIFSSITIFSASLSFWIYDSDFLYRLLKQGTREMLWYPMDIYGKFMQRIFVYIIPLAFVSYFPAQLITGHVTGIYPAVWGYFTLPIGVFTLGASLICWKYALRRYEGSGS